jgi:hypothetical protein
MRFAGCSQLVGIEQMPLTFKACQMSTYVAVRTACADITALLAWPSLKGAELRNLISLKQLLLDDPEQRLEELDVTGCKMLTSLRVASPALFVLGASSCYRLQVHGTSCIPASCCTRFRAVLCDVADGCCLANGQH